MTRPHAVIEPARHLDTLVSESTRLLAVATGGIGRPVPTCPEWTVADLLVHVGRVYRSVALHVREAATEMIPPDRVAPAPSAEAALEFASAGRDEVVAALEGADPEAPVWTWAGPQPMAFYFRRMAHETAVHRVDVELAADSEVTPVSDVRGADGIDELLDLVLPFALGRWPKALPAEPLTLEGHCGAWRCSSADGSVQVVRAPGFDVVPDGATVAGADGLLYLLLEGRVATDHPELEVTGQAAIIDAWVAASP